MFQAGLYARVFHQRSADASDTESRSGEYAARRGWTVPMQVREIGFGAEKRQARKRLIEAARRRENGRGAGRGVSIAGAEYFHFGDFAKFQQVGDCNQAEQYS